MLRLLTWAHRTTSTRSFDGVGAVWVRTGEVRARCVTCITDTLCTVIYHPCFSVTVFFTSRWTGLCNGFFICDRQKCTIKITECHSQLCHKPDTRKNHNFLSVDLFTSWYYEPAQYGQHWPFFSIVRLHVRRGQACEKQWICPSWHMQLWQAFTRHESPLVNFVPEEVVHILCFFTGGKITPSSETYINGILLNNIFNSLWGNLAHDDRRATGECFQKRV